MKKPEHHKKKSALSEKEGVPQPPSINPLSKAQFKKNRSLPSVKEFVDGIRSENLGLLSRAITLVESTNSQHQSIAQEILEACLPFSGNSTRLGITGVPGVGKSSFIEAFGKYLIKNQGKKLAVLAIDPSSQVSRGSILGDKTRMEELSRMENAFIRPSPAGDSLGGVARKTRETIILCEAAGYDFILIETVGVGQSETVVKSMVDCFLLLMLAGAGDDLQGIKRGIMEMADIVAINKADGDNVKKADAARMEYQRALHLFPPHPQGWIPRVSTCSALEEKGIDKLFELIDEHQRLMQTKGAFDEVRREQNQFWFDESIQWILHQSVQKSPELLSLKNQLSLGVSKGELSPFKAAQTFIQSLLK